MKDFMEANTFPSTTKSERIAGYRNGEDASLFAIARAPEAELRKFAEARNLNVTDSDNSLTLARKLHDSMTPEEVDKFNEALTNLGKKRENGYRNQALKDIAPGRRMSDLSDAELKKVENRAKQLKNQRGSATTDEMDDQLKKTLAQGEPTHTLQDAKDISEHLSSEIGIRFKPFGSLGRGEKEISTHDVDLIARASVANSKISSGELGYQGAIDYKAERLNEAMAKKGYYPWSPEFGSFVDILDKSFRGMDHLDQTLGDEHGHKGSTRATYVNPDTGKKVDVILATPRYYTNEMTSKLKGQRGSATGDELDDQLKKAMAGSANDTDYMKQAVKEVGGDRNFTQLNPNERTQAIARAQELKGGQRGSASEEDILDILKNFHDRTEYTPEDLKRMYSLDDVESEKIHDLIQTGDPSNLKREYNIKGQKGIPSPSFFSRGAQVADQKLPPVFSADQARNTLKNAGISGDELKVANDWLADQSGKIKKTDLVEAMNNGLKVNVVKKEVPQFDAKGFIESHPDIKELRKLGYEPVYNEPVEEPIFHYEDQEGEAYDASDIESSKARRLAKKIEKDFVAARDAHGQSTQELSDEDIEELSTSKWIDLPYPLKEKIDQTDWKETDPEERSEILREINDTLEQDRLASSTKYSEYQVPGGTNYREHLLQIGKITDSNKSVFNDPNPERSPLSIRFRDLWEKQEESGLSTEERNEKEELAKRIDAIDKKDRTRNPFQSSHFDEPNVVAHVRMNDRTDVNGKKTLFLEELQSDWHQQGREKGYKGTPSREITYNPDGTIDEHGSHISQVPDAPFKKDWPLS